MSAPARGAGSSEAVSKITSAGAGLLNLLNLLKCSRLVPTLAGLASLATAPGEIAFSTVRPSRIVSARPIVPILTVLGSASSPDAQAVKCSTRAKRQSGPPRYPSLKAVTGVRIP